jgi:hypothetical protein
MTTNIVRGRAEEASRAGSQRSLQAKPSRHIIYRQELSTPTRHTLMGDEWLRGLLLVCASRRGAQAGGVELCSNHSALTPVKPSSSQVTLKYAGDHLVAD